MESISQKDYYKAALESFHRNLITVYKKNGGMKDAVSVLKSFDPEMIPFAGKNALNCGKITAAGSL